MDRHLATYLSLPATTGLISARIDVVFANASGDAIDATVRFYAPQLELGPFASTPILPPVGTPGASTRGTDILTAPLGSLDIADNGACTVLWRGVVNVIGAGDTQTIAGIDDGTENNRHDMRLSLAGFPQIVRFTGGVLAAATPSGGPFSPNATIRAGMTIDGLGRLAASFNGGAVTAVTGGPTSGLTLFNHGISRAAVRPLWGETHTLTVLPRVLSDADLQAAVAAL
jgi:hypothetical protein